MDGAFRGPAVAWPGFDFLTIDSGINPAIASYLGAPYNVRGTDPAEYATAARDWWQQLDGSTPVQPASLGGLLPDAPPQWLKSLGLGAAGVLVGLVVLAFALFLLWKS